MRRYSFIIGLILTSLSILTACTTNAISATQPSQTMSPTTDVTEVVHVESPVVTAAPSAEPTATEEFTVCSIDRIKAEPVYDGVLLQKFETEDHFVVVTIDDGYWDDVMNQMLDLLDEHDATATFFVLGKPFAENFTDETAQRIVNEGHDLSYHAYVHPSVAYAETMTREEWNEDYRQWEEALRSKLGDELFEKAFSPFARVPYGPWTYDYLTFAKENGLTPVYWSADNHAFEANRMPLKDGGIIILHATPEDVPVLKTLLEQDWKVISLREAMAGSCE